MSRRKIVIFAAVFATVLICGYRAYRWLADWPERRKGPEHVLQLDFTPPFLTDDLAYQEALRAMTLDGYDSAQWQVCQDGRTHAPDGSTDKYLLRGPDPMCGSVELLNKNGYDVRSVLLELRGSQVASRVYVPP
jgi:hypothetical protein